MEEMPKTDLESLPSEWISAPSGNFYIFNGSYASIIIASEQVINKEQNPEIIEKYKKQFLQSSLKFFNKQGTTTRGSIGTPAPSRGASVGDVKLQDNYIDPYPNMGEKLLFTIPFSVIDGLVNNPDDNVKYQNEVIYDISDYTTKINFVISEFLKYQNAFLQDLFKQKTIGYENLDFQLESENLVSFNDNLNTLAQINEIDLSNFTTIKFSFDEQYLLKNIVVESELDRKQLAISFSYFSDSSPQNRAETNYFILNLDILFRNCKDTSKTYKDIVEEDFLYRTPKLTSYSDPINRSLRSGNTYGITNDDVNKKFASSQEISKKFVKEFQNIAKRSLYETPCLTAEEKERIDRQLEEDASKQKGFLKEISYNIGDTFVDNLPQILQKVGDKKGKEAANALGMEVLNRLGVCGFGDLVAMVANTTTSFLDPEEYNNELASCALERLSDDKLETFIQTLGRIDSSGPRILQKYRSIVGDPSILPPWKTAGYSPPNRFTDTSFVDRYKIDFQNPFAKEQDVKTSVLFSAYRDAIRLEVDTESILRTLTAAFPDEMGWLSFFTDVTKILLQKCAGITVRNPSLNLSGNLCKEKNFKLPRIPRVKTSGSTPASAIANQLIEELKNIIINLIVKLITSTMQQLFQVIAAGVSFDENYFKRGDYIPDLFQNENYMHDNFKKQASNKKRTNNEINNSVRTMLLNSIPPTEEELSLEDIDRFLKQISVSIGEYEKINLLKGEASSGTYEKVRFLAKNMGLGKFFRNDIDVEKFFLEMGKKLDVARMEADYFNGIYDYDPWVSFCILDSDMLDRAYFKNKDGITQEQIDTMKKKLKDIQKDKLCSLAETMGNPSGPILGELSKMITDKNSPIYNKIKNQEAEYFLDAVKESKKSIASLYSGDLYKREGVFDISIDAIDLLPIGQIGYNYTKFIPLAGDAAGSGPITSESFESTFSYDNFNLTINRSPINKNIEEALSYLPKSQVNNITSYFQTSLYEVLPENYFDYIKGSLKKLEKGDWEDGPYDNLQNSNTLENFVSLSDEKIKKFYNNVDDFEIPLSKNVPFNLLKNKQQLVQKYIYFSSLVITLYTELMFKSLNMYNNFTLDTAFRKLAAKQYIKKFVEENKKDFPLIKDNIVQILFSLPFQEGNAEQLSDLAIRFNEAIEGWLKGNFSSFSDFYEENNNIIEKAFDIFLEIILEDYSQDSLNNIFKNNDNLKNLSDLALREANIEDIISDKENAVFVYPLSGPSLRNEKFYFVGTPTIEGYPSGTVSLQELKDFISSNPDLQDEPVTDIWPEGWNPGIRISSISAYDSSVDPKDLEPLVVKNSSGKQAAIIPLASYVDNGIPILKIREDSLDEYPTETMKDGLVNSQEFKFFYRSMNIEQILTYYTNYYIDKTDDRIDSFGRKGFFDKTKETLLELKWMPYGFSAKLPLTYSTDDGPYSLLKTIKEMGQQNLKMLVLTNPGERIMDINFGVGISRFLFDQEDSFTSGELEQRIVDQVNIYLPYITITDINISPRLDVNAANVSITYFIDGFTTNEKLFLNLENDNAARGL